MLVDEWAQRYMAETLGLMPPDPNTVTWLMDQLATMRPVSRSPARALEMNFELAYSAIRTNEGTLVMVRNELAEASENGLAALTDDELCAHIRKPYEEFVASALQVLAREPPYYEEPEAKAEFQRLTDDLQKKVEQNPAARAVHSEMIIWMVEQTLGLYGSLAWHTARFNAFHAALEVYRLRARDGRLPETLPDGLPTDPFSGRSFDYQITPEGFQLRCRVKNFVPTLHLNEFPVAKRGTPGDRAERDE
jgi:hypothetical protein